MSAELTERLISAFYDVYNRLGFGFLEAVYASALALELRRRGLQVIREAAVDVYYAGEPVGHYRVDLLVERSVIVEVKAGRVLDPAGLRQLLNYLRASDVEVGFLLHFGPKPFFRRLVSSAERGARDATPARSGSAAVELPR